MQAWVTNNPVLHHGQSPVVAAPTSSAHARRESSSQHQSQPLPQAQPRKRVVNLSQPTSSSAPPASQNPLQQPSPPRSRAPIVNSQRPATANTPRLPVPIRPSQPRETNLNFPRHKSIPSESLQSSNRPQGPFWDQSTVDGSAFSDTASNIGSNAQHGYRHRPDPQLYLNYHQQIASPHHQRPSPRKMDLADQPDQMLMGADGLISEIPIGNGLARSASTPDARAYRHGFKETIMGNGNDPYSDDSAYEQSPEKTPSVKRLHHPLKTMTVRNGRGESFAERNHHLNENGIVPTVPRQEIEVKLGEDGVRDQPLQVPQPRLPKIQTSEHEVRRSTIFADTDTPMVSHQDEAEARSAIEERVPTPKPAMKSKPQTSRQLFKNEKRSKGGLRESAMPRVGQEKQHTTSKKRSLELDYDDGQLSSMEYARLRQEKFDYDPAQAEARSAVGPPEGTLADKLSHFHGKDEAKQAEFFTKMSINEWEASGEWFMERFASLMDGFKKARVAKREVIESFETEIADREEAVRKKMQGIGQTLAELKSEGSKMILNKDMD
ncbi:hypothetical protein GGR57DRAFT_499923 [Xylariaceae sp. FL1272]|nr:hypothetical protein GGR57DRAFT_499923 [Xylariaceae sp. FL1272]